MAGVKEEDLHPIGPWPKGVNNIAPEESVPDDQLRDAQNTDILDSGWPETRDGFDKIINGTRVHSLWADERHLPFALYVDAGEMIAFDVDLHTTNVHAGFSDAPVSYAFANRSAYYSNGDVTGRVDAAKVWRPWGVESPGGEPTLSVNATVGGLAAGCYMLVTSYRSDEGEDSGAGLASIIDVSEGGGIQASDIPQPVDSHVHSVRFWLSPTNGDVVYWHSDIPVGMTSYLLGVTQLGEQLKTQFFEPMPAGTIVREYNGRLYSAYKNVLSFSEAYRLGLRNPTNALRFPSGEITLVQPSRYADLGGLYVACGGVTYFLRGSDPVGANGAQGFNRVPAYASGAVYGSDTRVPGSDLGIEGVTADDVPVWLAENGVFCAGLSDGNVVPITQDRLRLPQAARAAAIYRESASKRQVLFNMNGMGAQARATATDRVIHRVFRNGVEV